MTELSEDDIKELYNTSACIDNDGNIHCYSTDESCENLFTLENWNINSKEKVTYTVRNSATAIALPANWFHYGNGDERNKCFYGCFKPNTQYKFDMWIDYDDVVYQDVNRPGGIRIYYSDNAYSDYLVDTGNTNNPIGWKHKVFYSDPTKSVSYLLIYYYTSIPAYYRWDSVIIPMTDDIGVNKNGIVNAGYVREGYDAALIGCGGNFDNNQVIEI